MRPWQRLTILLLTVGCVTAMGVQYDTQSAEQWSYPSSQEIAADYEAHIGEEAFLFGTVESISGDTARVRIESEVGKYTLIVESFDSTVERGGLVQVVGELRPGRVLVADNTVVVNTSGDSTLYKYAVSLLGAALVVVAVFRYWRLNTETLTLEVRTDG